MGVSRELQEAAVHQDRRASARISLPFETKVRGINTYGERFQVIRSLQNFSAGGIYILIDQEIRPGTKVFVSVRLALSRPDAEAPHVAARGRVVRVTNHIQQSNGIAVAFDRARFLYPTLSPDMYTTSEPMSVITIDPPLPCVHPMRSRKAQGIYQRCGMLATIGAIAPLPGDAWELLPMCRTHAREFKLVG